MRLLVLAMALLISFPLCAQEKQTPQQKQQASKKKKAAAPSTASHQQASKEQIRKFNELQKKQKDTK